VWMQPVPIGEPPGHVVGPSRHVEAYVLTPAKLGRAFSDAGSTFEFDLEDAVGDWTYRDDGEYHDLPVHIVPPEVREGFVRKVFGLVGAQLLVIAVLAGPILCVDAVRLYVVRSRVVWLPAFLGAIACVFDMTPRPELGKRYPTNYYLLAALTAGQAMLVGSVAAAFALPSVLLAVVIAGLAVLAVTIYGLATKRDLTAGSSCVVGILLLSGLTSFVFLFFPLTPADHILLAVGGALCFLGFLVLDVRRIAAGEHRQSYAIDDYVFAAMTVYLDLLGVFRAALELVRARCER